MILGTLEKTFGHNAINVEGLGASKARYHLLKEWRVARFDFVAAFLHSRRCIPLSFRASSRRRLSSRRAAACLFEGRHSCVIGYRSDLMRGRRSKASCIDCSVRFRLEY